MRSLALAFVLLVLSGCSSPAAPDDTVPQGGDAGPSASLEVPPQAAAPKPRLVNTTVDFAGDVGISVCVGPTPCIFESADPRREALGAPNTYLSTSSGSLTGGHVEVTWAADSPLTQNLRVVVGVLQDCPGICVMDRAFASIQGPSPLVLDVPTVDTHGNVGVQVTTASPDGAGDAVLGPGQAFQMDGFLTFVA